MTKNGNGTGATAAAWSRLRSEAAIENELTRRLYRILLKWVRYADSQFEEWTERSLLVRY